MRIFVTVFLLICVSLMAACQSLGYYAQSARGQIQLLNRSEPIDNLLQEKNADEKLRQKLAWIKEVREFASEELDLPKNKSYTRYADIDRNYVVWNIFAAPELSLDPYRWCYPIVGCQAYRGYFSRQPAVDYAGRLREQGYDVSVGGVRAYSTLGWFDDPVINTFIHYPENDLAGLIFHELAHQVVYVKGDTVFNESFATLVEIRGVEKWLKQHATPDELSSYRRNQDFENDVISLIMRHKKALDHLYRSRLSDDAKRAQKQQIFSALKQEYQRLKISGEKSKSAWDSWFARDLNNANMIAIGAYYAKVDDFNRMFENAGGDFSAFYGEVKKLAKLSKRQRDEYFSKLDEKLSMQTGSHPEPPRDMS